MRYILWLTMIIMEVLKRFNTKITTNISGFLMIQSIRVEKQSVANRQNIEFMERVNKQMNENFSNGNISVDILAQLMNMSRTSFTTKLKIAAKQTPGKYILDYRMKKAAFLLSTNKDIRMSEVAYEVGFADEKYFRIVFKKYYGVCPSEYKKQYDKEVNKNSIQ